MTPRTTAVAKVACPWGLVNIAASPGCFMLPISIRIEGYAAGFAGVPGVHGSG